MLKKCRWVQLVCTANVEPEQAACSCNLEQAGPEGRLRETAVQAQANTGAFKQACSYGRHSQVRQSDTGLATQIFLPPPPSHLPLYILFHSPVCYALAALYFVDASAATRMRLWLLLDPHPFNACRYIAEEMIPELEDFENRGYFTKAEIKQMVKKRLQFEYLLKRKIPLKADFLR